MNLVHRATTVVAALSLSLSLGVSSAIAVAGGAVAASACAPADAGLASGPASNARGGVADKDGFVREMQTGQVAKDLPARAKGKAPADFSVVVDVYFHVITDGAAGNVSDKAIRDQIAVLNKTYGGREGGENTGFTFELAGITRSDNAK